MAADESDKATILRRRALLVGSTLAAIGSCARGTPPAESAKSPVVAVPNATDDAGTAAAEPDAADLPPRVAHDGDDDAPSVDVPDGVNQRVRTAYEHLGNVIKDAYQSIHEIESSLPDCSVTSCEARWRPIAERIYDLDNMFHFFYSCGAESPEAKAYVERERELLDRYRARRQKLDERLKGAAGQGADQRFEQLVNEARSAHPVPCLSIACVPW